MATLIPERLGELRRSRHMTRWSVARQTGVPRAQLRRYERGEAGAPAVHRNALAQLFGVSVLELMGWTKEEH